MAGPPKPQTASIKRQTGGTEENGCCTRAAKVSLVAAGVGLTSFRQVSECFLLADTHLAETVEDANLPGQTEVGFHWKSNVRRPESS